MISTLRFRFNFCEKRQFEFKGLNKVSSNLKPHRALPKELREDIDMRLENKPLKRLACRLLYDHAARCQDLLQLRYNSFVETNSGAKI